MKNEKTICPLKYLADVFGGKWKLPILCVLSESRPQRYSVVKRRVGNITNMMLAQSLKELEAAGIVNRTQYNEVPPRVEYSLTERGRRALPMLKAASEWALQELGENGLCPNCTDCQSSC